MASITSSNAVLMLGVVGLFGVPQQIKGFAVDDAFETDSVAQVETLMSVDGLLSGGKVFTPYKMPVHIQADSPSLLMFDTWRMQQDIQKSALECFGIIKLKSINRSYVLKKGFLTMAPALPAAKKVLQPVVYEITWERIFFAPL